MGFKKPYPFSLLVAGGFSSSVLIKVILRFEKGGDLSVLPEEVTEQEDPLFKYYIPDSLKGRQRRSSTRLNGKGEFNKLLSI